MNKYFKGKTEKGLFEYIDYVNKTADEYDKKFIKEVLKLDIYYDKYDYELIQYLQYMIESQHILDHKIISSLPGRELIGKDKKQLHSIIKKRIFFGACYPII